MYAGIAICNSLSVRGQSWHTADCAAPPDKSLVQLDPASEGTSIALSKDVFNKTRSSIERTIVSKNWIQQLHTLLVLHFNCCLTTEHSETTAHCNGNFDTDNQIYVP
jgi:hypothetical protein